MPMPISQKASKRLRFVTNYRNLQGTDDPTISASVNLEPSEQMLGIYQVGSASAEAILVTDKGLHVLSKPSPNFIPYDSIEDVNTEASKEELRANESLRKLKVKLKTGVTVDLMITGQHEEGGLDLYGFETFLIGAINLNRLNESKV